MVFPLEFTSSYPTLHIHIRGFMYEARNIIERASVLHEDGKNNVMKALRLEQNRTQS